MTILTPAEVAGYAKGTGFSGNGLVNAVAIALTESGGKTDAVNVNTDAYRSRDRGLWQINDHWHPEVSDAVAFSPAGNAAAAYRISSQGRAWSQWTTYTSGDYKANLGRAQTAVNAGGSAPVADDPQFTYQGSNPLVKGAAAVGGLADALPTPGDIVGGIKNALVGFAAPIGVGVLGLACVVLGVELLIAGTKAGKLVGGLAETVALPEAKGAGIAAKVAGGAAKAGNVAKAAGTAHVSSGSSGAAVKAGSSTAGKVRAAEHAARKTAATVKA